MKRLRTLNFFKNSKLKFKNQKPIAVDDFLKAYPMIPLSTRSNLAGSDFNIVNVYFSLFSSRTRPYDFL